MIKHVLLVHNFYRYRGGEDTVFLNEKALLGNCGIDVTSYERHNDDITDQNILALAKHSISMAWNKTVYKEISALISREKPQIAHFHNTFQLISPSAYAACHDNNVPVVQTLHNYRMICPGGLLQRDSDPCEICVGKTPVSGIIHSCYRNSAISTAAVVWMLVRNRFNGMYAHGVDRYIALTNFAAGRFVSGRLPASRIVVKPNFLPDPPQPGSGGGGYTIFVGRLSSEKGILTLLRAWETISEVPLKIIGEGPLAPQVELAAKVSNGLIEYLGYQNHDVVMDMISRAEALVVPSECYEGFPMTIVEAYACGTPVVASKIGSLDEIVLEGKTGFKFDPGNAEDIAATVTSLWKNITLLRSLRAGVRQRFESHYTSEINFSQLQSIYEDTRSEFLRSHSTGN